MLDERGYHNLPEGEIEQLSEYISRREHALDHTLLPYGDPHDKDVLVFGSGYGSEVLWCVSHGAKSILATDITPGLSPVPFERAMADRKIVYGNYEFRREPIYETALTDRTFDLIISRDVFEHVLDLKGVLGAFRKLLRPGGRLVIHADSLWYSSLGGHIHKAPWEHLYRSLNELRTELSDERWDVLCNRLNRMTVIDFIEAIRFSDLVVLQLHIGRDPNLAELPATLPRIRERLPVSATDLSIMSLTCELCWIEHL